MGSFCSTKKENFVDDLRENKKRKSKPIKGKKPIEDTLQTH